LGKLRLPAVTGWVLTRREGSTVDLASLPTRLAAANPFLISVPLNDWSAVTEGWPSGLRHRSWNSGRHGPLCPTPRGVWFYTAIRGALSCPLLPNTAASRWVRLQNR